MKEETKLVLASLVLLLTVLLMSCSIKVPAPEPKRVLKAKFVLDPSTSGVELKLRCDEVRASIGRILKRREARVFDISVIGTGDASTAFEPTVIVPLTRFDPSGTVFGKPGDAAMRRAGFVDRIWKTCRERIRSTASTPLYLGIYRAAESLRAHCRDIARQGERCAVMHLAVHSDLRETVEHTITRRLSGRARGRKPKPLPRIDLSGIELSVCGVSDTKGARRKRHDKPGALTAVWSAVLGREIVARSSCPRDAAGPGAGR